MGNHFDKGKISWPEKFPTLENINKLERKISDRVAWEREYMLRIISTSERVIHPEWIKNYDELPKTENNKDFRFAALAVDLAVAKKERSDYTSIVSAYVFGFEDKLKIYILPNPVNRKMTHDENLTAIKDTYAAIGGSERNGRIYVEDVGYQKSVIQELNRFNYPAKEVRVHGTDKRARLMTVSHLVQNGTVVFPKNGCKALINQIVNFGSEKHDDLADAFSILLTKIIMRRHKKRQVGFISFDTMTGESTECFVYVTDDED